MRSRTFAWSLALLLLLGSSTLLALSLQGTPPPPAADAGEPTLLAAAQAFVATLDDSARAKALFPFEDEERYNWHFVPRERRGLPLKEMTATQRRAAHRLLQSALSARGYLKATGIMHLEAILKEIENGSPRRDAEKYYFSLFGTPDAQRPWGWRVEGHHLSLNFSAVTNELSTTPAFFGTNPAVVPSGAFAGWQLLGDEEHIARTLVDLLDARQRAKAIISSVAPDDIVTMADRKARLERFEGLPASEMTPAQRAVLLRLVETYTHNLRHDLAHEKLRRIEQAGLDRLHFAWAGSTVPGEKHYYRIHGPTVLFEYDNTQNDGNHVHTVWRDFDGDWGEDLLRRHYEQADHDHGH